MAKPRSELSSILHGFCSENVYFQPPNGLVLSYPCLLYELNTVKADGADNTSYIMHDRYTVTYITRNPDDPVIHDLLTIPMCRMSRAFVSDNLYHYSYDLYY
jgi:hypothetical protein